VTYRSYRQWYSRLTVAVHAIIFVGFAIAGAVALSQGSGGGVFGVLGVLVIMFASGLFIAWVNLFRFAFELTSEDDVLSWRSPLNSGRVHLIQLRSVRNVVPAWPWPLVRFECANGPSLFTWGRRDLRAFVDQLLAKAPALDVDADSYSSWRN